MRSYLVLRLNHRESRQRLVNKIVCSPKQLLNKLNALTDSHGEYAYKTIREVIDSYTNDDSSMTIVDLATLDFVSTWLSDDLNWDRRYLFKLKMPWGFFYTRSIWINPILESLKLTSATLNSPVRSNTQHFIYLIKSQAISLYSMQKSCSDGWVMSLRYGKVATVFRHDDIGITKDTSANSTSPVDSSKVAVLTLTLPRLLLLLRLKLSSSDDWCSCTSRLIRHIQLQNCDIKHCKHEC